jgi:hypothetical protein
MVHLAVSTAVVIFERDPQSTVSVRFEPRHFQFPPKDLEPGRGAFREA